MNKSFKKIILPLILIVTLFFLSGCAEMTRTEKTLCYNLTSKSFAYIPNCETEQSCYEKVSEMFNTNLGYEQESEMYKLKNNLSRSWFFYNKAMKEIKKAPNYCLNGEASELSSTINQTSQYLDYSFLELDQAVKKSFEIVINEEKLLSSEEIDLVKEEGIFDSLIELRQITSEIDNGATNSGTYYSFYIEKIKEFNTLGIRKGFSQLIEQDSTFLKIGRLIGKEVYTGFDLKEINLPLIGINYNNIQNTMENILFSQQSLRELEKLPVYEFTLLYSSIAGNNNSAIKRFSDLINKTSSNRKIIEKNLNETWKNIELEKTKLGILKKNLENLSLYELIQVELLQQKISGGKKISEIIEEIETNYLELKKEKNSGSISLGAELSRAKNINENLIAVNNKINFEGESEIKKMLNECDNKANELLALKTPPKELEGIYSEMIFYSKKVTSTKNEEKLNYCTEMIKTNKNYILGINNYEELEYLKTQEIKSCFIYLEQIFEKINLYELKLLFTELKKEKVTKENLNYFEKSCNSIKRQADNEINSDSEIRKVFEEYEKTKQIKEIIKKMKENLINNLEEIEKKSNTFDNYFTSNNILEIYLIKSQLLEKIIQNNKELTQLIEEKIINYFKENYRLIILSTIIPSTDEDNNLISRLIIQNSFYELNRQFKIEINQKLTPKENNYCTESYIVGEKTVINFKCLNYGNNTIDFFSTEKVSTEEKDKIIYATNEKSLIQRSIKLITENYYPKILVSTKKISEKLNIIVNGEETNYYFENNKLKFYLENATKDTKISVYYYLTNLINLNYTLLNEKEIGAGKEFNYKIIIKNNYDQDLISTISLPIYINNFVNNIEIYDEQKIKKANEVIDNKIVLKNILLITKEEKEYFLKINISNKIEYYYEILENLQKELIIYGEIKFSEEIKKVLEKIDSVHEKQITELIKNAQEELNKIKEKQDEENNLKLIRDNLNSEIIQYEEKIKDLEKFGLFKEKELLIKKVNLCKSLLESNKKADLLKGLNLLQNEPLSINKEIQTEVEKLTKIIKESVGKNQVLIELAKEFFNKKEQFDWWKELDLIKSKEIFVEIKELYKKYFEDKNKLENNSFLIKNNQEYLEMLEECKIYISFLEIELSVDESKLINAKFIQPITLSRLKKLKLDITEIQGTNFSTDKEKQLVEIKGELKSAVDSIKKQTISLFNKSIDEKKPQDLLQAAKSFIDSNKFVSAFLVLKTTGKKEEPLLFLGLIPIGVIVILALVLKKILKKKEKEENLNKKIVLENWDT